MENRPTPNRNYPCSINPITLAHQTNHMLTTAKNLINTPVITESGQPVGKVLDINVETETQSIHSYAVKPSKLISGLIHPHLQIHRGQVVDISQDKIIVEDNFDKGLRFVQLNKFLKQDKQEKSTALSKE